jgi:glycosyltransferase involved in cell wall biosynthesis
MQPVDAPGALADPHLKPSAFPRSWSVRETPDAAGHHHFGMTRPQQVLMTADAVGGVWRYSVDISATLIRRGVNVTLAVMGPPPTSSQRSLAAALGIDVVTSPFKLEWMDGAWDDVERAGAWLLDLERRLQPDLIHVNGFCHASLPWQAPAVIVAHSCVCSWWRSVHGEEPPPAWAVYRTRVAAGLAAAAVVIAPTAAMLGALVTEYGWTFSDARVIPNGRTDGPDAGALTLKSPLVLAAGRIWDKAKNIATLCAAAPSLDWPVYVAGDARAPSSNDVPDTVELSDSRHVTLLGHLDPEALARWFNRAAIYALPARYEPFGLSILEAAASGCALVLGDIASLRENWSGAALFVAPGDRLSLIDALRRLIACEDERLRLAARARERAKQFSVDRTADAYIRAYSDALGAHRRGMSNGRRLGPGQRGME